ncbi:hypothetical protein [Curtobacterium sp. MCBA15_001]|uniref:hypothetical protein n=1 Tax=Curtobacterium sp. MCBA15_001 TaxID=1898731 RepID=UPI0008DCC1C1|nr:hypothetical protein [Curtobacterium sp. MCBA15_001]OIH96286.1 hypothetical protein BIU90_00620 [Curtobacterium sp. MCBA15_001]
MPTIETARRRSVDRRVLALAIPTLASFAVATAARVAVDQAVAGYGSPTRYGADTGSGWTSIDVVSVIAGLGATAAAAGVLLFGATLVTVVRRHHHRRLTLVLGGTAAVLVLGAVAAAVVATSAKDFTTVADASLLRTALAGLAVASLPAVAMAALRTHRAAR